MPLSRGKNQPRGEANPPNAPFIPTLKECLCSRKKGGGHRTEVRLQEVSATIARKSRVRSTRRTACEPSNPRRRQRKRRMLQTKTSNLFTLSTHVPTQRREVIRFMWVYFLAQTKRKSPTSITCCSQPQPAIQSALRSPINKL